MARILAINGTRFCFQVLEQGLEPIVLEPGLVRVQQHLVVPLEAVVAQLQVQARTGLFVDQASFFTNATLDLEGGDNGGPVGCALLEAGQIW